MENIILIGMKSCGKSTAGKLLAVKLSMQFVELDERTESLFAEKTTGHLSCREILKLKGEKYFRDLETEALKKIIINKNTVLATGGGTPLSATNRKLLRQFGKIIFLDTKPQILLARILKDGIPGFFYIKYDPRLSLDVLLKQRKPVYETFADFQISISDETPDIIVNRIIERITT